MHFGFDVAIIPIFAREALSEIFGLNVQTIDIAVLGRTR
jgi:hypothetical protein